MTSCCLVGRVTRPTITRQQEEQALDKAEALNSFLAGVEKRAFRMAQVATGSQEEALDIVQDAMLLLVKKYQHRGVDEWGPLFHRILQNKIRDWYRRQKVRNGLMVWLSPGENEEDPIENLPGAENREPMQQLNNSLMTDELEHALQSLPIRQQQTFLLRVWEGLDVNETAKAMGISSGSVKTHYSRAVHTLRDKLGEFYDAG